MVILHPDDFPYVEFGTDIKRKIRLLASPYTSNQENMSLVVASVPVGGVSEAHVHEESDEYIFFDTDGKAIVDGVDYAVRAKSIVHAPKGILHECVNTSDTQELNLICVFVPPFKPYAKYGELIEKTNQFLDACEVR